jgi:hypothetical protein
MFDSTATGAIECDFASAFPAFHFGQNVSMEFAPLVASQNQALSDALFRLKNEFLNIGLNI